MTKTHVQLAAKRPTRFALSVIGALSVLIVVGCGKASEVDHETTATLIQPVARIEVERVQVAAGNRTGEEIYQNLCTSCHAGGLLNAPPTGDTEAWAERLAKGLEANVGSVVHGLGAMPPRGGGSDLTDTEVERAVVYLLNAAGGDFTEPPTE